MRGAPSRVSGGEQPASERNDFRTFPGARSGGGRATRPTLQADRRISRGSRGIIDPSAALLHVEAEVRARYRGAAGEKGAVFPFSSSHSIHTVIIRLRLCVVFMNLPNHHSAIRMLKPCDRVRQVARPAARPSCLSRISCTPSQSYLRGLPSHDRAATAALIKAQLRCAAGRSRSVGAGPRRTVHWTPLC
jgi:hypothetical protein